VLSIQRCREILGDREMGDATIEQLRAQLYALATAVTNLYVARESRSQKGDLEERAAILEFDANMPRPQAERIAFAGQKRHRRQ
jgi:hypothetical protein